MATTDRAHRVLLLALLGACTGTAATDAGGAGGDVHRIAVRVDFEPALMEPGDLEVAHECGERFVVATARSGVDLRLRPGPATLTLRAGGARHECVLRIAAGMPPFVWHLQ